MIYKAVIILISLSLFPYSLQSKLFMEGFRSLKEGEPVEFTFKKSPKGLESIRVTGPGGSPCLGSERRPKGKTLQKRKPKGDR
jgi:protein lin-28